MEGLLLICVALQNYDIIHMHMVTHEALQILLIA